MMIIEIRPVVHVDSSLFADDWLETQEMEESRTPLLLAQANRIRVVREMGVHRRWGDLSLTNLL